MKFKILFLYLTFLINSTSYARGWQMTGGELNGEDVSNIQGFEIVFSINSDTSDFNKSDVDFGTVFGGYSVFTKMQNPENINHSDGEANYINFGFEGKTYMLSTTWLEAVAQVLYSQKISGNMSDHYLITHDGKLYDPLGGLNFDLGLNAHFPPKVFGRASPVISAKYLGTFKNKNNSLIIGFGMTFY